MDARERILTDLRQSSLRVFAGPSEDDERYWEDVTILRTCIIRLERGDDSAWLEFLKRISERGRLAVSIREFLLERGYLYSDSETWQLRIASFPEGTDPLSAEDADALLKCLTVEHVTTPISDELPSVRKLSRSEIMYMEYKGGAVTGPARIGRVTFSKSRKTIYYKDCKFQSLKGVGHLANFEDVQNGGWYWISRCRVDGQDTLYPGVVEIDDDVREEYWTRIRNRPDLINASSFRSEGKYSKRRPQPGKPNHPATGPR